MFAIGAQGGLNRDAGEGRGLDIVVYATGALGTAVKEASERVRVCG